MTLDEAIAVFDKSADRTRPNAQTEAWAVIRAELMRVLDAPVVRVAGMPGTANGYGLMVTGKALVGQRVRLLAVPEASRDE